MIIIETIYFDGCYFLHVSHLTNFVLLQLLTLFTYALIPPFIFICSILFKIIATVLALNSRQEPSLTTINLYSTVPFNNQFSIFLRIALNRNATIILVNVPIRKYSAKFFSSSLLYLAIFFLQVLSQ